MTPDSEYQPNPEATARAAPGLRPNASPAARPPARDPIAVPSGIRMRSGCPITSERRMPLPPRPIPMAKRRT